MKRIINIKFLTALAVLFVVASSCTKDFETINTDPNNPSTELAAPDMLLTNIIESATDRTYDIFLGHEMGNCWVQHMAKVQYTDEDRYIYRPDVVSAAWSSFYASSGMDVATLYKVAVARENDNYAGVAMVMKVYITSLLTDMFGDVPYSEAWRAGVADGGIVNPVYDTQESIYRDIVKKLDTANMLLTVDGKEIGGDILFDGDILKWKKFANSMRMRLLLRMSAKDAPYVTAELTKMVGSPATYPVFESNDDNAQLVYLGDLPNNNPINENRKTRDDHRVSKTVIDKMWTFNSYVDYRVVVYANLANGDFVGMPNGLTSSKALAYLGNGLTSTSKLGSYFTAAEAPGVLMSYTELQFILSEGVQRGLITGAPKTAQEYYEEGIYGSYNQYAEDITYYSIGYGFAPDGTTIDELAADYIATDGAWDSENPLKQIATEKWLAMFEQGLQSRFEWVRTGYPVLVAGEDAANGGVVPVRFPYPTVEYATNPTNVKAAAAIQGTDDLDTRIWWAK
jgi:hypothetical protein